MGLFGTIIGTVMDVASTPVAIVKDVIPGCDGYVDGNRSHTSEKIEEISNDVDKIREKVEEL